LPWLMMHSMPRWLGVVLALGLLSALLSSADTCIMTAATTFEHDLRGRSSVFATRVAAVAVSAAAVWIAWGNTNIIGTLLIAYSIFNCGVFPVLLPAIVFYRRLRLNSGFATVGIITGGTMGCIYGITKNQDFALYGMAASAMFSLFAIYKSRRIG